MVFLLDDLLLAPLKGVVWLSEKIKELSEKELYDEDKVREELISLQAKLDMEEITKEEYLSCEKKLLERINEIQKWKKGNRGKG